MPPAFSLEGARIHSHWALAPGESPSLLPLHHLFFQHRAIQI
jgi:hypothetical protein